MKGYRVWTASLVALFVVSGCSEDPTGPGDESARTVAVAQFINDRPVLYLQNTDGGNRVQVHFDGAVDSIPGNLPDLLPVRDAQIKAIGAMEWSPDGSQLAVVLTLAFDQSQVVVIDRDGRNARTASPNTQIILSDVAWSADGKRIAYTMSTLPHAQGVDVFTTDLTTHRVTRLTTSSNYGGVGVTLAWDVTGQSVYVSRVTGFTGTGVLEEYVSRVDRINVAGGGSTNVASNITGQVQAISGGAQPFAITLRKSSFNGADILERVYSENLITRATTALTGEAVVHWVELSSRNGRLLVAENVSSSPGEVLLRYRVLSSSGSEVLTLRGIESGTAVVEVY